MDGDDYLELECYEVVNRKITETDADMILIEYIDVDKHQHPITGTLSNIEFITHALGTGTYFTTWLHIHKRSLYDNEIISDDRIFIGEDVVLTMQIAYFSKTIVPTKTKLYNYVIRPTALSQEDVGPVKITSTYLFCNTLIKAFKDKAEYHLIDRYIYGLFINEVSVLFVTGHFLYGHSVAKQVVGMIKQYPELKEKTTRRARKLIKLYSINSVLGRILAQYYILKKKI